jgi:stalled ribosome rescue protein Dom34
MSNHVGMWIDHKQAVIVSVSADRVSTTVVESQVGAHPHFGGQQDGGGEKKYEERHTHRLERFYDEVIRQMGAPDEILVLGPGEAKVEFEARLNQSHPKARREITVEAADKLTDSQLVARVKEHFGLVER